MIRFVMLTHRSGEPIWLNPAQVISVAPVFDERYGDKAVIGSAVTTNRGTVRCEEHAADVVSKLERGLI